MVRVENKTKKYCMHSEVDTDADLDGRFAGDVRNQEVHGNVLAVYVLIHHVPDGLGHHVGVQVCIVLQDKKTE